MGKYSKRSPKFFENIREVNGVKERRCSQCKEWKPENTDYYYMHNKSKPEKGFQSECKECSKKRSLELRHKDIELTRERDREAYNKRSTTQEWIDYNREKGNKQRESGYQADWRRQNPDKVKMYSSKHRDHDITKAEEEAMLKVFDYQCAYCGMTLDEHKKKFNEKLHNDHVDDEGYNDLRNDVPACKSCNCSKWEHPFEEWYKQQSFYTEEQYNKIIWWTTEGYKDYIEDKPPYKIKRVRIYNEDGTYYLQHQLWILDEKRNMIKRIATANKKKDLKPYLKLVI